MQKLSTAPFSEAKKSGTKREASPCTPYKRKARGKENKTGFYSEPYKTARAHTREQRLRYDAAGEGAQAILSLFGTFANDFGTWAKILYRHHDRRAYIIDKAYEFASRERQGEIRDALTAFQKFLNDNFPLPKGGAK